MVLSFVLRGTRDLDVTANFDPCDAVAAVMVPVLLSPWGRTAARPESRVSQTSVETRRQGYASTLIVKPDNPTLPGLTENEV